MTFEGQIVVKHPEVSQFFKIPSESMHYQLKSIIFSFSIPYDGSFLFDKAKYNFELEIKNNGGIKLRDEQIDNLQVFFHEKKDNSILERIYYEIFDEFEKNLNDFKSKNSSNKIDYILLRSKVIGISDSHKTGMEWVEVNSNRIGLDFYTDTYENFFTPEYQVVNVLFMRDIPEIINLKCNIHNHGYDWECPYTIEDAMNILEDIGFKIEKGKKLYIKELDRVRIENKKYYDMIQNPYHDKKLSFKENNYSEIQKIILHKSNFILV